MKQVLVKVEWLNLMSGGRHSLPRGGARYLGVTSVENTVADGWSIAINWLDQDSEEMVWYGLASFLFEHGPIEKLTVGTTFPLLEGPKTVANASVISSAKVVEGIVKLASAA